MVKLTVLYNLEDPNQHDEFVRWRTTEHQEANAGMPNVVRTDFYVAKDTRLGPPAFRYVTEVWYATMQDLEASFFTEEAQAKLAKDIESLANFTVLVSEQMVASGTISD